MISRVTAAGSSGMSAWLASGITAMVTRSPNSSLSSFAVSRGRTTRKELAFVCLRMPAVQPDRRIVARREEDLLHDLQSLGVGERQVPGLGDERAELGRIFLGRGRGQHDAADEAWVI